MRVRFPAVAAVSLALGACTGGGTPAPPVLGYSLPDPASATYLAGDTAKMSVDFGGQSFDVDMNSTGTYGTTFERADDGIQVTMEIKDLHGTMTQPMQGPTTVDGSDIEGPLVFTLDRKGATTLVSTPTVKGMAAQQLFDPLTLSHSFFPRLPARPAPAGTAWTDTIHYGGPVSGGKAEGSAAVTYTVAGDTVVAGRSLLRITVEGTGQESRSGVVQEANADFTRTVKSSMKGWVLWDASRHLLYGSYTVSDGTGTMDMSMAPQPFGFRIHSVRRVSLGGEM